MLATKNLIGREVLGSLRIQKFELRKRAKHHSAVSIRPVVHHVASLTQHQSGNASVSASAVASGGAAKMYELVKMGHGEGNVFIYDVGCGNFDGPLLIVKDGKTEAGATLGDVHTHGEDFDKVTVDVCTQEVKRKNRLLGSAGNHLVIRFQNVVRTDQSYSTFFHAANHRDRLSVWLI